MERSDWTKHIENSIISVADDEVRYINKLFERLNVKTFDYDCDLKLKVGEVMFPVHRDMLADASDYFSAMFSVEMREKDQDVIEMHGISPTGCKVMIDYIYHGRVTISSENIDDVLETARFFHIEWMIAMSQDFMIRYLSLCDYDYTLQLADQFFLGDLQMDILKFLGLNFRSLVDQPRFLSISAGLFETLLSEDFYIAASEFCIMKSIIKWVNHDFEAREKNKIPFLSLLRYPLFKPGELQHIPVEISENETLAPAIEEAKQYHSNPSSQCLLASESTLIRGSEDVIIMISAFEEIDALQYKIPGIPGFFREDMDVKFMKSTLEFARVAVLGNFMYVGGGYTRDTFCSSACFYRFDPRNHVWVELTTMNQPRVSFSLVANENGIFAVAGIDHQVIDGFDREQILETVEFYNPQVNDWRQITSLPYGYFDCACVHWEGALYLSGGITNNPKDSIPVNHMLRYELLNGDSEWTPCEPMLKERQNHGMTALNGKLYVFGGRTAESLCSFDCRTNEVYDIETNQWTEIVKTPEDLVYIHSSTAIFNDKIFLISGKYINRFLHSYDPETDELSEGELCGPHFQKLAQLCISFPHSEEEMEAMLGS